MKVNILKVKYNRFHGEEALFYFIVSNKYDMWDTLEEYMENKSYLAEYIGELDNHDDGCEDGPFGRWELQKLTGFDLDKLIEWWIIRQQKYINS